MQSTPTDGTLVVAIDSSTTATKAIVVDAAGNVLALGKRDIALLSPEQGFGEHDPRQWRTSTRDAIAEALAGLTPAEKERVAALGITHQRESFAPFTADGTPLRNGILWLDIRAADQAQRYGTPEIHALSGAGGRHTRSVQDGLAQGARAGVAARRRQGDHRLGLHRLLPDWLVG